MASSQSSQSDEDIQVNGDVDETPMTGSEIFWRRVQDMEEALEANVDPSFTSHQQENESLIYELGILLQPPPEAPPDQEVYPPITALMRIRDAGTGNEASVGEELSRLWTYASAVDEDDGGTFASFLSNGRVWDSLHPLYDDSNGPEAERASGVILSSYLTFPQLVFPKPGRYRIRIHLMRIVDNTASEVLRLHSHLIHIHSDAESETSNEDEVFIRFLREQGVIEN